MPARRPSPPAERGLLPGKRWLTYGDVEFALGFERTFVRELVERGQLIRVGKGKATRITADSVRKYAEALERAAMKERGLEDGPVPPTGAEDESRGKPIRR